MHNAYPLLVPTLDRQGVAKYTAPECVESPGRKELEAEHKADPDNYGESVEIREDGSCTSDKLIAMNAEQCKSREYMLTVHGFDPAEWEIVTARNNVWNTSSKRADGDGNSISTLYSSKITVQPKRGRFDLDEVLAACMCVEPLNVPKMRTAQETAGLLEIPYDDMHWGVATLAHYMPTLVATVGIIREHKRDEIVLTIGSDLIHCDNLLGTTMKGTVVEEIDFPGAIADALTFYSTLIKEGLLFGRRVIVKMKKGNHDATVAFMFCKVLEGMFPSVEFDLEIRERKVHRYGEVCIGWTHGDKGKSKSYDRIFNAEFPEFKAASVHEIHGGHYHHETAEDVNGVLIRTLPTAGKLDNWHADQGFVGSRRRFQVFEYTRESLFRITYV